MSYRRVEVLSVDDEWVTVDGLHQVIEGDMFRMFEPDGTPVEANGQTEWKALYDGYKKEGVGNVHTA